MREYGIDPAPNNPDMVQNLFEQQSTLRDAAVSAVTLNLFNNHAEKIMIGAVAQLVNNLHALFLSGGEHCICTPAYHVFDMMQNHMGATALRVSGSCGEIVRGGFSIPNLSVSASVKDGKLTVTLANLSMDTAAETVLIPSAMAYAGNAEIITLTSGDPHDCNTFEEPDKVHLTRTAGAFDGKITVPAYSVITVIADLL